MYTSFKHLILKTVWTMLIGIGHLGAASADIDMRFSGFANITGTYSGDDVVRFRTSLLNNGREGFSFAPDTILGLQTNVKFNEKFDAVGQVVLQDRFDDDVSNYVELAFLRYQINRNWSSRVGRFSANSYLYTDSRYVGHSHTWLRVPIEMYAVAGSVGNMDGVQTNYTKELGFGAVKVGLSYGQNIIRNDDSESGRGPFRATYDDIIGVNVELQSLDWRLQAAYLTALVQDVRFRQSDEIRALASNVPDLFRPFAVQLQQALVPDSERITYLSFGGQYLMGNTELIAEYTNYNSDWATTPSFDSAYVFASRNIGHLTPYIIASYSKRENFPEIIDFSEAQATLPPLAFAQLSLLVADADLSVKGDSISQISFSAGIRWDFADRWSLKAQIDHFKFDEFGSGIFSADSTLELQEEKSMNVLAIGVTTVF